MSWLSTSLTENLTNITGQISTFTKDMLTEGTVEVDDRDTKSRLRELELTLYTQREEYDRVKELNHELQERAEAAELQISSISREYRKLLQDKENDLVQLREQLEMLKEHGTKQDRERFPSFSEDSFVDGSSHEEVQYLKAIISKLQTEKKELIKNSEKESLHKELDHYQHELATLHSTYSQRIATLNKRNKEELDELKNDQLEDSLRIEELEKELDELKQATNEEDSLEILALKEALGNSEKTVTHLNQQLELLRKSSVAEEHLSKSSSQETANQPEDSVSGFELINKESAQNYMQLSSSVEQGESPENISELKALIDQLESEKQDLVHQRDQAVISEEQTSASLESLKEELSSLGIVTMELMKEVEQSQGVDKEKSIEIESLKKVCQVKGDGNRDEVVKLKDILAALWKKYAAVVLENEKVRLELHNVKQRLLFQLQDRHGHTKALIDGIGDVRTKLEGELEGHRQEVRLEKEQLVSMIPEVENDVEEQEECVARLQEENEQTNKDTKGIVHDIGKIWSVNDHVASLHAEKAVLERTIVGLEEKVEELERLLASNDDEDTPRSSISTVISVDSPIRAAPDLSEPGDDFSVALEPWERRSPGSGEESAGLELESGSRDDVDINKLMERLKEYEETIQEFELIKEDWEGEKQALENLVVELRKRLKNVASVEKNVESNSRVENNEGVQKNHCLNEIQELLIKKNYLNEEEILELANEKSRTDVLLSRTLEWLRRGEVEEPMIVKKQENDGWFSDLASSPGDYTEQLFEVQESHRKGVEISKNLSEKLSICENELEQTRKELEKTRKELEQTRNELEQTRNELDKMRNDLEQTRNELDKTRNELDKMRNELEQTKNELDQTRNELDKTRNELDKTRNEVSQAIDERGQLECKLKFVENELEESYRSVNTSISEKDNEVHKLRNIVEQLKETLSNIQNDKNNDVVELQEENEKLQSELGEVTTSYKTMTTLAEERNEKLAALLGEKSWLESELAEVNLEKEKLVDMVNERDERIEELQDVCDSVEQRASFLQKEGKDKLKAFSEVSEECSLLKEEKSDLFSLLEEKDAEVNSSLRENDKLSELLHQQELASEEIKRQNTELAQDLERWRVKMEEVHQTKETLNRDLDAKAEEILILKENNIELANQSYEYTKQNNEISGKLSMLEQLISENSGLKSEKETLMEALSQKEIHEKELKDSYNLIVQEKQQLEKSFSKRSSESEQEFQRKIDEIEILRLEVARLTREAQEKDHMIRAQVSSSLVSGGVNDAAAKQEHVRRVLEEKDVEIAALRTKNESLLTVFAENEQNRSQMNEQHDKQIRAMLEQQERMLEEINEKGDQMVAFEDKLEMMKTKAASKDQASALIHAEHQKLLHLNESQGDEIAKLREKVLTLGLLVAEKDHGLGNEVQKMHQQNQDLRLQVDALQGEQERLLMLVHEKDKQLSRGVVHEAPLMKKTENVLTSSSPSLGNHTGSNHEEYETYKKENEKLTKDMASLRTRAALLNDLIENERNTSKTLQKENDVINERLRSLEMAETDSGDRVMRLQHELKELKEDLSEKEREVVAMTERHARENNRMTYEINTLRNEKDEIFLEQNSQVEELQKKLSTLLDVISSDQGFKDEQFEILENRQDFQRLVSKVRSHRARLLSDKDNELRLLKEQVQTLSSVQNISTPELETKLERFIQEKDDLNQRLLEVENEKLELLEEKENELTSLQTQVLNLSSVLKQKERDWLLEKENLSKENVLLEKRTNSLQNERDSLSEFKTRTETEVTQLRDEMSMLSNSATQKHDVLVTEKERRVKELERDLEDLKQRHARSLQQAQDFKSSLDEAKELAKGFEKKKEKELERLRTHLVQVEDSYTQEALASEQRENELRVQLDRIQEQLLSSSHSLQDSNRTASMKVENLQEQLMSMTAHRDEVLSQLEQSQEQNLQYMRSVENLQMVLEQFQREKESELKTLRENHREKLNEAQGDVGRLRERENELQQLLHNASDALNKADRLGEDLKSKEDEIEALKLTVSNLEADLQSSHDKLRRLTTNNDGKIEKSLMKNMLMAYFNTSEQKRADVVAVLGHILSFTDEEIREVGSGSHPPQSSGWFSGLLSYGNPSGSQHHDKTFSELFVSFLEKESETEFLSSPGVQSPPPPPSTSLTRTVNATVAPNRLRTSQVPMSPLASSTPYENARPVVSNPLLVNARMDGDVKESSGSQVQPLDGNALLGSTLRPSLDLPTITNSSSSSSALRKILFDN